MNKLKKITSLLTLTIFLLTSTAHSGEYCTPCVGCGYEESRQIPSSIPTIGFVGLAIAAIVVVALEGSDSDSKDHKNHQHSHH